MPTLELHLGAGDKLVSDVYDDVNGEWSGIAISDGDCPVGEFINTGAKMLDDLDPLLVIKTSNPKSLDVVIAACERAKARLEA